MASELITLPVRLPLVTARLGLRVTARVVTLPLRVAERLIEAALHAPAPAPVQRDEVSLNGEASGPLRVDAPAARPARRRPRSAPSRARATDRPRRARPRATPGDRRATAPAVAPQRELPSARTPPPEPAASPFSRAEPSPRAEPAPPAEPFSRAEPAPRAEAAPPAHVSEEPQLVESFADPGAQDGTGAAVHVEEPWDRYRHMTATEIVARLAGASREALAAVELYERTHRRRRTVLAAADRQLRLATVAARRPT